MNEQDNREQQIVEGTQPVAKTQEPRLFGNFFDNKKHVYALVAVTVLFISGFAFWRQQSALPPELVSLMRELRRNSDNETEATISFLFHSPHSKNIPGIRALPSQTLNFSMNQTALLSLQSSMSRTERLFWQSVRTQPPGERFPTTPAYDVYEFRGPPSSFIPANVRRFALVSVRRGGVRDPHARVLDFHPETSNFTAGVLVQEGLVNTNNPEFRYWRNRARSQTFR